MMADRLIILIVFISTFTVGAVYSQQQKIETIEIFADTVKVQNINSNQIKTYWKPIKSEPTAQYENRGLIEKEIESFSEVEFTKESFKLVFDTMFSNQSWKEKVIARPIKFPDPQPIAKPRYKDRAIVDIQFIDVEQGLSSSYIFSIQRDSRDIIWIGTYEGGLIRYDGHVMYNFTEENGLPGNSIRSIFEDRNGNMWFGTAGNGFCMFDGHTITDYSNIEGLENLYVYEFAEDAEGRIWLSTKKNGVFVISEDHLLQLNTNNKLSNNDAFTVFAEADKIWIGTRNGFSLLNGDSITTFIHPENKLFNHVKRFYRYNDYQLWLGTRGNPLLYNDGKFIEVNIRIHAKDFCKDEHGNLWAGTVDEGLFKLNILKGSIWTGTYTKYTEKYGLSNNYISELFYSDGYIWIGTYGGGINKFRVRGFNHITQAQGIGSELVWGFTEDENKDMWFATETKGISYLKDTMYYHFSKDSAGLRSYITLSTQKDRNDNLWFGFYEGGVCKVKDNTLKLLESSDKRKISVISIFNDSKNNTWLGTFDGGVYKYYENTLTQINTENGLLNNDVYDIYEDESGKIWFASDGGLSILDESYFYHYTTATGFPSNEVRNIVKAKDGAIWVGTYGGGIVVFDNDQIYNLTKESGLSSDLVMSIIEDDYNRIWVGTESGLNLIKKDDTADIKSWQIISFDKTDGLKGMDFYTNSVFIDNNDYIWWGTGKGVTYFNLKNCLLDNLKPKVKIQALQVKQRYIDFHSIVDSLDDNNRYNKMGFEKVSPFFNTPDYLKLSFSQRHVTFYFAASTQANVQNVRYRTRLYPLEKEWSLPTEEYKADYRGIPPGEYRFEVQAISNTGVKSDIATQLLYIKPPWWMSPWMYVVYFIIIAGIIGLLHRWRTSILKRRQYELERIVQQRTVEIQEKNEELNVLLDQITEQRNEIEAQRDTVVKQKDQLEQVNISISQSIDYAQRIQSSLMPDYYEFNKVFDESFMIFKPRDIVSGDFFWWAEVNDKIISIVADCTGHGVPGAFMSILGITFLREIVLKEKVVEPHEILNRLREEIITALKQKNIPGEIRDGLEMTVISIDKKNSKASFSGAYNSIYKFSNGTLEELKGQKFPVAAYPGMKDFEKIDFDIQPGNAFYMFSDGYHDQFSEKQGKKVKKSRFYSLIERIADKEMKAQKEELVQFLDYWQGNHEQIDDILVLGFRIPDKF